MPFVGMDVDAVEGVGRSLQTQAQELEQLVSRIDSLVGRLPGVWEGRDSTTFVSQWWPRHKAELRAAGQAVQGLGDSALANARDQRSASGSAGVAVGTPGVVGGSAAAPSVDPQWWLNLAGGLHSGADLVTHVEGIATPAAFGVLGKVVGAAGLAAAAGTIADGASSGDGGKVVGGIADVAIVGVTNPAIGIPLGIGKVFVDETLPYSTESQDSVLDFQAERMFGHGTADLSADEASALADRYSSPWGPAFMISDTMDHSWHQGSEQVGIVAKSAADGARQAWDWLTGGAK